MFIPARERGYWIPVILYACFVLADWLTGIHYRNPKYYAQHGWPKLAAFACAAIVLWFLSANRQDEYLPGAAAADIKTPLLRPQDSFFWVPAKYWPALSLALGLLFCFVNI
ncbi:MAG TPA: hypothetical protein VND90_14610 [Terracidiphilus sp.]|nr:hypothetical protein [Terracidiphilus sp.]